jgi:hypothetical protein
MKPKFIYPEEIDFNSENFPFELNLPDAVLPFDFSPRTEFIEKLCEKIQNKKKALLKQRLEELDIEIDLEEESKKLFKSIVCVIKGHEETYYYNDDSYMGLRIITFIEIQEPIRVIHEPELSCSIKSSFNYY